LSTAIRFNRVSKRFTLHHQRPRSFQELTIQLFQRNGEACEQELEAVASVDARGREEFWALRDVSFAVEQGETVGIIGPNGAGKSTVLKLVSRIIEPTSGEIEVNGRVGALLELGAGFHPDLSGRENIYLNGSILGLRRSDIDCKRDEIIAFSELERFIDMPVKHYSSGMRMRLGFSIAAHIDPEILLVDEVLAVGDESFQRKCLDRIYDLRRGGVTILFVSHGTSSVARLCHRAMWLAEGQVVADGEARDVTEDYLAAVNLKDRERLDEEASRQACVSTASKSASANGRKRTRLGSGEVRIVDVVFLDKAGVRKAVFTSGEDLTIRLTYEAAERVENPVFGVAIHRDDNVHVAGPNTKVSNYHIAAVDGRGLLDFVIPGLPLSAGRYELSVSAYDQTVTHQYDYLHRAFSFSVQPGSPWDALGVMRLSGRWRLGDGEGDTSLIGSD
jgi:lipopolysaccharide transport system ATP-binding protein